LRQYWHKLQDSERRTLLLGAAVLALGMVYLLLSQAVDERSVLRQRKATLLEQEKWLQEQAELLAQLDNTCPGAQRLQLEPEALLRLLAQRAKLDVLTLTASGNRYVLVLRGNGNDVLLLAQQSICQGLALERIDLSLSETGTGAVRGENGEGGALVEATMELRDGS